MKAEAQGCLERLSSFAMQGRSVTFMQGTEAAKKKQSVGAKRSSVRCSKDDVVGRHNLKCFKATNTPSMEVLWRVAGGG